MPKKLLLKISLALAIPIACAQTFEVASIKLAEAPDGRRIIMRWRGGPGSSDPELLSCQNCNLIFLVLRAYDLPLSRVSAPEGMEETAFSVTARIPAGTSKDQFKTMFQNLLAERLRLKAHFEKKEMTLYELSIAKGGVKFKEAVVEPPKSGAADLPSGPPKLRTDVKGYPILGNGITMAIDRGRAREQWIHRPISYLVSSLTSQLQTPVIDKTGLAGTYDIVLSWIADDDGAGDVTRGSTPLAGGTDPGGPTLEQAVQSQLGLKLERKKGLVDVLVVDDAQKTPTEN